ncbi:MAG: glycosyltransferase family 2 protein [Mariprofundaceae bacterium]
MSKHQSNLPLVSIVIPAFNAADYLREAIDSIIAQEYPNIELIVLNDGSTDNSVEVLKSYPEGSFYWESHVNMGQSATLNKGWAMSQGEIISYLSADDALLPSAIARSVETLLSHENVVMTYCDYMLIDGNGDDIRRVDTPEFDYEKMVSDIVVQPGPGPFFRSSAFKKIGGWNTSYRQIPDLEYWLRLGLEGDFLRIPEILAKFRVHNDSQSYAPPSVEKSEEILAAIPEFFAIPGLSDVVVGFRERSQAFAYVFAARFHMRAGRFAQGLSHLFSAWRMSPRALYSKRAFQLIGNAILYRVRYILRQKRT